MIDEYFSVKVDRISPETPMPIMTSTTDEPIRKPGGAANVAYQFKHFNVDASLICFWDALPMKVYKDHKLKTITAWEADAFLPIKRRFLDGHTQIVRHDIEQFLCGRSQEQINEFARRIVSEIKKAEKPDVAIFSDYDKGFFKSDVNFLDQYRDVVTIVDPKRGPLSRWKGCTIFKPNKIEAENLSGYSSWRNQAQFFMEELGCEAVVITFGGEKVAGIYKNELFEFQPCRPHVHVDSVVGAGDCFAACFAMAIGQRFTVAEAAEIAWNAGAVYVQNNMNRPIIPAEILPDGIVEPMDLKDRDFKLVFTNGCFDLLHEGHLMTLNYAKSKGDKLVVAINSDESVKRLKGPNRPIKPLEQRMAVMAALEMVDFVVSFDEDTPLEIIKEICPDVLIKGSDYKIEDIVGHDLVPEVYRAPIIPDLSTSNFLIK
jgi:D-beta-D-heptose 7-phosphate kinase/D-beta-D-heptose 1-phosphate adenosyltransferase